jgi:hypothetical protein
MKLVKINTAWHICFMNRAGELMSDCGEIKVSQHGGVLRNINGKRADFVEAGSDSNFVKTHRLCERCEYLKNKWGVDDEI